LKMNNKPSFRQNGLITALLAYFMWGLLPVYWKILGFIPSWELIAWRVAGCGVFAWIIIFIRRRLVLKSMINFRLFLRIVVGSLLIGLNWILYIWAVGNDRILEASLAYYINPLINVILGIIFFSEALGKIRFTALLLALIGIIIMTLAGGTFPWISIILALTFGLYGMVTKGFPSEIDSIEILAWEMVVLSPLALIYLLFLAYQDNWHFLSHGTGTTIMLSLAGFVTLIPLWLFGAAARKLPLGLLGFLQYITPTFMLILGVLVYTEPFNLYKGVAFVFILTALSLYSSTLIKKSV
jgi:chloramphenicol-sensitive protein RarD